MISPQQHRRFDQGAFVGLTATALLVARRDRRAAGVIAALGAAEGTAYLVTDYPPPGLVPLLSFRAHNRLASAGGTILAAIARHAPGLTRGGRATLATVATVPIIMAIISDTSAPASARQRPAG